MKKILVFTTLFSSVIFGVNVARAQEKCGLDLIMKELISKNPSLINVIDQYSLESQHAADAHEQLMLNAAQKTTANVIIPVVFHIILNQNQINAIGGVAGIRNRITTQMEVINTDFNARNHDSTAIPAPFKPFFGNPGISFQLAHTAFDGTATDGYEIKIADASVSGFDENNDGAKSIPQGGLRPWDNTKYLNIWIVNLTNETLLGYAYSPHFAKNVVGDVGRAGVVLDYGAFGVKPPTTPDYWFPAAFKGRTLTHELGHYFNLWHTWGRTSVGSGSCSQAPGQGDEVDDTPNQFDATQSCKTFPFFDQCTPSGNGIMYMNYMDYSGDACYRMFTKKQAARMQVEVNPGGNSHSLTTNPQVLLWPTGITTFEQNNQISISPNPSNGIFNVNVVKSNNPLNIITVTNSVGQVVKLINSFDDNKGSFNIDLSNNPKGVYILHMQFEEGSITRKVTVQ